MVDNSREIPGTLGALAPQLVDNYKKKGRWGAIVAFAAFLVVFLSLTLGQYFPHGMDIWIMFPALMLGTWAWLFSIWHRTRAKGYSPLMAGLLVVFFPVGTFLLPFLSNLNKASSRETRREEARRKYLGY